MKKLMIAFAVTTVFAACDGKKETETKNTGILIDTSTLYNNSASTDIASMAETAVLPMYTGNNAPQYDNNSNTNNNVSRNAKRSTTRSTTSKTGTVSNAGTTGNTGTTKTVAKKLGWSKSAQGAVIGGVGGAIAGAVISKKKVKGAVIGGVVGAAGGYIIGRQKDKKDGRVQ